MGALEPLFVTELYRAAPPEAAALNPDLERACRSIAADDAAGRRWCAKNGYIGYTSYASLDDLPQRDPTIAALVKVLDRCAAACARLLELDLAGRKLKLDSLWINVLAPGGAHSGHIHPHSALSGTYYVAVPPGAPGLKLEDPRLGLMMAAPGRKAKAARPRRTFVEAEAAPGVVLMWESWLRHEVPLNQAETERISLSFNYGWR